MREEAIVVAAGAFEVGGPPADAERLGLLAEEGAEIDLARTLGLEPGQLPVDVGADLIAASADRGAEVDAEAGGGMPRSLEGAHGFAEDTAGHPPPPGMHRPDRAILMGEEDGDAVGDGDGEGAGPEEEMPVSALMADPPLPRRLVPQHRCSMNLLGRGETRGSGLGERPLEVVPPRGRVRRLTLLRKAEGPGVARRHEDGEAEVVEAWNRVMRGKCHATSRRDSDSPFGSTAESGAVHPCALDPLPVYVRPMPSAARANATRTKHPGRTFLSVEDDAAIRAMLRTTVATSDDRWLEATNGSEALGLAIAHAPELILLDLGLPDLDGLEVCRRLRAITSAPVIVLSARHSESDKVALLDAGADDYVTKPFGPVELRARIEALLRRARHGRPPTPTALRMGDLVVDLARRSAARGTTALHLTPTEWALLAALVANAGRTLTHQQLFRAVWGDGTFGQAQQYLRVYVTHLRKKIEDRSYAPRLIITEPGVGYRFEPEGASE